MYAVLDIWLCSELELQSQTSSRRGQHLAEHTDQTRTTMTKDNLVPDAGVSNQVHIHRPLQRQQSFGHGGDGGVGDVMSARYRRSNS